MNIDERLIFLISQPRAGSTMLQRILGSHPEVHTLPEPWIMLHPLYALRRNGITTEYNVEWAVNQSEAFLDRLPDGRDVLVEAQHRAYSYLYECALSSSGKSYFLDKTPRYYHVIPELYHVFPKAKFIYLLRNPLAVLASILKSWVGNDWTKLQLYRCDLSDAPRLLIDGLQVKDVRHVMVRYEDVVTNPEETIKQLCSQLNISFHLKMIEYGQQTFPEADWGDQRTIYNESRPEKGYKDRWVETLMASPQWQDWGMNYLRMLGPELLARMGYSYDGLSSAIGMKSTRLSLTGLRWHLGMKDFTEYSFLDRLLLSIHNAKSDGLNFKKSY
jgi:Sulfotransferase family